VALAALGLTACDPGAASAPIAQPAIVGLITATDTNLGTLRILVEENPRVQEPLASGGGKLWLRVGEQTPVFVGRGESSLQVGIGLLQVGQRVAAAVHTGVRTSYPGQASADTVIIMRYARRRRMWTSAAAIARTRLAFGAVGCEDAELSAPVDASVPHRSALLG
jgi:hypothetical protein